MWWWREVVNRNTVAGCAEKSTTDFSEAAEQGHNVQLPSFPAVYLC